MELIQDSNSGLFTQCPPFYQLPQHMANVTLKRKQIPILIQSKHDYNKNTLQQCTLVLQFPFWARIWLVELRGENRNVWLYCIAPVRGVCQSVHATQCAWRDWCFCHPPASKAVKKPADANRETSPGQAHKQKRGNLTAPHLFGRNIWGFCCDANEPG